MYLIYNAIVAAISRQRYRRVIESNKRNHFIAARNKSAKNMLNTSPNLEVYATEFQYKKRTTKCLKI